MLMRNLEERTSEREIKEKEANSFLAQIIHNMQEVYILLRHRSINTLLDTALSLPKQFNIANLKYLFSEYINANI